MKLKSILIDRDFLAAVVDLDHPLHDQAVAIYQLLVDDYQAGAVRLFAPSTMLRVYPREVRRSTFAPIESMWVARQYRTAAAKTTAPSTDIAMMLVLLQRERCWGIATTSAFYDQFDLTVYRAIPTVDPVGDEPIGPSVEQIPDGYVSYETEPLPARQSTDE